MSTKYGIPCIKLPGGQHIQLGRAIRFVAGIAIILALLAGWIEAAVRAVKNGKTK